MASMLFTTTAVKGQTTYQSLAYNDSITFKIDNAAISGNELEFSIMFWRTNQSWEGSGNGLQDTVMGNVDLYFWVTDELFNKAAPPQFVRTHANVDVSGGNNLLQISTEYYAYRYLVKLKTRANANASMTTLPILYNEPQELCRVKLTMTDGSMNPGLQWDKRATGGQSAIGEPLIESLDGDVMLNPDGNIQLTDYERLQWVCEGSTAKFWAKGHSADENLKFTWYLSDTPNSEDVYNTTPADAAMFESNIRGNMIAQQLQCVNTLRGTKWGDISYRISGQTVGLERVDTLEIRNVPEGMDSVYLQVVMSDNFLSAAPKKSAPGDIRLFVRDSIHGWLAASDPAKMAADAQGVGASDRTDTVMRCPGTGSLVAFYFFGPDANTDPSVIIGSSMDVELMAMDGLGNPHQMVIPVNAWGKVTTVTLPETKGKPLFRGTMLLPDVVDGIELADMDVWILSIATEAGCHNGVSFSTFDTISIRTLGPDEQLVADLTDVTVSAKGELAMKDGFTDYALTRPALGRIDKTLKKYYAPTDACGDPAGCSDTILYTYTRQIGDASCNMQARQVVNLSDLYYLKLKVYLEGPYNAKTGKMYSLKDVLPMDNAGKYVSPYDENFKITALPTTTEEISDWVEVSLRTGTGTDLDTKVDSVQAFLLADGTVVDAEGNAELKFNNLRATSGSNRSYYVVVRHRNHLMIRSTNEVSLAVSAASAPLLDLTQKGNVFGGNVKILDSLAQLYGLYAGDVFSDALINISDQNGTISNYGSVGYIGADVDFNSIVNNLDRNVVVGNNGKVVSLY